MKIYIIGTRGIPNNYGGFEQFAEKFALYASNKDYSVVVYNSHNHPYDKNEYKGVEISHQYDPEFKLGTIGQFIYDLNCILDVRKKAQKDDIVLQLGYTSSAIWNFLIPKKVNLFTNMDGLEWKRTKFSKPIQLFLKFSEQVAVKFSDFLIADSMGIKEYIDAKYKVNSRYIPYGAELVDSFDENTLKEYNLKKYQYNLIIARLEPENNIETIIKGYLSGNSEMPLIIIGKINTKFGQYLKNMYGTNSKIKFMDGIYNKKKLDDLRNYSNLYFHGHSVGGTNPSLLEAMGTNTLIIAHNNIFNKSILEEDAFYFNNESDISKLLSINKLDNNNKIINNQEKIKNIYNWSKINDEYLEYFDNK